MEILLFLYTELLTNEFFAIIINGVVTVGCVIVDTVALKKAWEMLS